MPKDDYFAIIYKILQYLYECMIKGVPVDMMNIRWDSKAMQISEEYWKDIVRNIYEDGYIKGVVLVPILGSEKPDIKFNGLGITTKGVEYLQDNSKMKKAAQFIQPVTEILKMFI